MPRKPKNSEQPPPPTETPTVAQNNGRSGSPPKKKAARKTATAVRKPAGQKRNAKAEVTDEAIRVRAYFISQERIRRAIPGDPKSDWIEARRQLLTEIAGS